MIESGDFSAVAVALLVGRQKSGNKPDCVEPEGLQDMVGYCQVAVVDRVEGAAQQTDSLFIFCCVHHFIYEPLAANLISEIV